MFDWIREHNLLKVEIKKLKKEIDHMALNFNNLNAEVATLQATVTEVAAVVNAGDTSVADQASVDTVTASLSALNSQLAALPGVTPPVPVEPTPAV